MIPLLKLRSQAGDAGAQQLTHPLEINKQKFLFFSTVNSKQSTVNSQQLTPPLEINKQKLLGIFSQKGGSCQQLEINNQTVIFQTRVFAARIRSCRVYEGFYASGAFSLLHIQTLSLYTDIQNQSLDWPFRCLIGWFNWLIENFSKEGGSSQSQQLRSAIKHSRIYQVGWF